MTSKQKIIDRIRAVPLSETKDEWFIVLSHSIREERHYFVNRSMNRIVDDVLNSSIEFGDDIWYIISGNWRIEDDDGNVKDPQPLASCKGDVIPELLKQTLLTLEELARPRLAHANFIEFVTK